MANKWCGRTGDSSDVQRSRQRGQEMQSASSMSKHWTSGSTIAFVRRIASDFVAQIEMKLEHEEIGHSELAERLKVSVGRVSQVMNSPGNLTLKNTVNYATAVGAKVAVVVYEDGDPSNIKGPIAADVFRACWEKVGRPRNMFELAKQENAATPYPCVTIHHFGTLTLPKSTQWVAVDAQYNNPKLS